MKTSRWRRAVENRCVSSACLKALSDRSVWVLILGFFMFLSAVSPRFSLILDPEVDWKGRLEVLVRNLMTMMVVY